MIEIYAPKITIIVAVYNGSLTLSRCIKSIILQSYPNMELIIIDGGSSDGSVKIIEDNSDRIAYWESKRDKGIYHAWNKALFHATGDWICFLGSDDYFWENNVIEKIIPTLQYAEEKDIRLVYGRIASINKMGEVKNILGMPWEKINSILSHTMPPHPGLLHHAQIFKDHGLYDESFRIVGDYEFLLRELKTGDAMFVEDVIVAGIQYGGMSCNIGNLMRLISEDISARKKHRLSLITTQTAKYYLNLFYNSIIHKILYRARDQHT
jgi:glycosyltransferase involved in cell wall biosynthesis